MIKLSNTIINPIEIKSSYPPKSIQRKTIDILSSSNQIYIYPSIGQLKFELNLRNNIVKSAYNLYKSNITFKIFRKSKCNTTYWNRTNEGGFSLKKGVRPSIAVRDIFINGSKYATECATAIVIIYYKALLDIFSDALFNELFPGIQLMNWIHLNKNLAIMEYERIADSLPGDCRYFKNPEVNPVNPEWQGENVIDMSNGLYYGHGMGINNSKQIIKDLNAKRKDGATISAHILYSAKRQNYEFLYNKYIRK